jgi:hypothetical protein
MRRSISAPIFYPAQGKRMPDALLRPPVDELVLDPKKWFGTPDDVLHDNKLSAEDKKRILESWKLDESRLAESTDENMTGGEESHLRDVARALLELEDKPAPTD